MHVAVVGNAPLHEDFSARIDACDVVIRFNSAPEHGRNGGRKTDILFLMNSGKSMQENLADPAFLGKQVFHDAGFILLPYHPEIIRRYHPQPNFLSRLKGRKADLTWEVVRAAGDLQKRVTILPPNFYEEGCVELSIPEEERRKVFPSTGFLGILYAMRKFPLAKGDLSLYGFGWRGWKRHPWDAEREWVTRSPGIAIYKG